jgi:RNA polymerase sigma-70 factor (ECF subfamily)
MDQQSSGLEAAYRAYRADLLRFLTARIGDSAEAEELLQELWIKMQHAGGPPIANARAYLFRMAQNLFVDRLREHQRRERREKIWAQDYAQRLAAGADVPDPSGNAEDVMLEREETAQLASALGTLPNGARRVFEMHKVEGLSHSEVASKLGISKSGVEKHMAVALKYLRRALLD